MRAGRLLPEPTGRVISGAINDPFGAAAAKTVVLV